MDQLAEAMEQVAEIQTRLKSKKALSHEALQVMFEHAYHHMNFAWNARFASSRSYSHLTTARFNKWSRLPKDIWELYVEKGQRKTANKSLQRTSARAFGARSGR